MRRVMPAIFILVLAAACSQNSTGKSTPGDVPSVAPQSPIPEATTRLGFGTPIVGGTVVPAVTAGVDPVIADEIWKAYQAQIRALNAANIDEAYGLYSKCAQTTITKDQLRFGKVATGTLEILSFNVLTASTDNATAGIEVRSLIFVGNQNLFKSKAIFVRESGMWKIGVKDQSACSGG